MEKKASLPSTERDWKPKHRWREPVEQDTLRTFLLKPSRTVLRTGKQVNHFIFLTSTVSLPFWSANELSTFTHMHNTSEPNPVEICTSSGLDTRVQNFSSSLNIMTVMKIFLTAIYWSTKIVKRRKGNFLVTRNLQEGWWHFLWGKKDQIILTSTPWGKWQSAVLVSYSFCTEPWFILPYILQCFIPTTWKGQSPAEACPSNYCVPLHPLRILFQLDPLKSGEFLWLDAEGYKPRRGKEHQIYVELCDINQCFSAFWRQQSII